MADYNSLASSKGFETLRGIKAIESIQNNSPWWTDRTICQNYSVTAPHAACSLINGAQSLLKEALHQTKLAWPSEQASDAVTSMVVGVGYNGRGDSSIIVSRHSQTQMDRYCKVSYFTPELCLSHVHKYLVAELLWMQV